MTNKKEEKIEEIKPKREEKIEELELNKKENDKSGELNTGELEKSAEEYKKQAEENLAGWQRAKADFINYKRDQKRILSEFRKYANEDIMMKFLPTIDGFQLAIDHLPEDLKSSDWAKGIICIKSQFDNFLKEAGIEEIKSIGEKFDTNLFESFGEEESEKEEGTVIAEVQKGYKMDGKVIRPARVKIAKRKED